MQVIRKRAVVHVGLDALSDAEVAAAVGNSMFSDLVSVAGHIYKFGIDDGLPGAAVGAKIPINVHADEFNELMGDEFIPMVNKGGGAGVQVTAYTQTLSDIEARIGNRAKAGQVVGNFNNLFMLRVRETATAELLTRQLPKGRGVCHGTDERRHRQLRPARQYRLHVQHPGPHQQQQRAVDRAGACGGAAKAMLRADRGRQPLESPHAAAGARSRRSHAEGSAGAGRLHATALRRGGRLVGEPRHPRPAGQGAARRPAGRLQSRWPPLKRPKHERSGRRGTAPAATTAGLIAGLVTLPFRFFGVLCGALLLCILIECVGMHFFWPDQGWRHAQGMLHYERISSPRISRAARWCRSRGAPRTGWSSRATTGCS